MPHDRHRRASYSAVSSSRPLHDLLEGALAADVLEQRPHGPGGVGVVPRVERVEAGELAARRRLHGDAAQPAVDAARRAAAVADRNRDHPLAGHHVAAGEDAGVAGHHALVDLDPAVLDARVGELGEQREVGALAEREDHAVGVELLVLAGRLGEAVLVQAHALDPQARGAVPRRGRGDRGEPAERDALLLGLAQLVGVGGHPLARAAVDDHGLRPRQPPRAAGGVQGGVAAAVHDDAPPELRALALLEAVQQRDRVDHVRGGAAGDLDVARDVRADREEGGVVGALAQLVAEVGDALAAAQLDAEREDPLDLRVEHLARQAVGGDAVAHHPPGPRGGVAHRHVVPAQCEVVGGGEARGPGADDEHAPPRGGAGGRQLPARARSPRRRGSARRS